MRFPRFPSNLGARTDASGIRDRPDANRSIAMGPPPFRASISALRFVIAAG